MTVRPTLASLPLLVVLGLALSACAPAGPPQALPLAGRGASAEDAGSALAPDMMWAPTTYEAGSGLPTLGGDRTVHRLTPGSDDDLMRVAEALGISGEIIRDESSRRIPAGEGALESWDGAWFSYWSGRATDGGSAVACTPDGECEDAPTPERPANLPTAGEAQALAMAVFQEAGLSLDGAEVTVDDGITAWHVSVQYRVAGMLVDGLTGWASVDSDGISDISGPLGSLEEVGAYPTITTVDAIDRLNEGWGPQPLMEGGPAVDLGVPDTVEAPPAADADNAVRSETDEPGEETTVEPADPSVEPAEPGSEQPVSTDKPVDPTADPPVSEEPYVEPEPVVLTVTGVEWALTMFWSWDGSGVYLLPAYRYTVEGQEYQPVVAAVTDDVIAPPPVETGRPDDSVTGDGTPTDVVPPDEGTGGGTSGSSGSAQ